jgi:CRISPR-associated protein Cst1
MIASSVPEHYDPIEAAAGLHWTGHDLPDMGIATLLAFSGRELLGLVTLGDLEKFAEYLEQKLRVPSLRSHASVLFTINAPYLQPSFPAAKQDNKAHALLRSYNRTDLPPDGEPCAYCGRPSVTLDTTTGRAYRELVPLLTGQGTINFAPYGRHGLSLCGLCLVALQALALGAPSCEGRAIIIGADDPRQLVDLISLWLPRVQARIQLSETSGTKLDPWKAPRTRLVDYLGELATRRGAARDPTSFRLYHASNSGQGPSLDIHVLDASIVSFVQRAQTNRFRSSWKSVERRAWRNAAGKSVDQDPEDDARPFWRNTLYEDLFRLPAASGNFVQRWLLRPQRDSARPPTHDNHVPLWPTAELFLEEVLGVDASRIQAIRDLGDALAQEIDEQNDRQLFRRAVFLTTGYPTVRRELIRVSRQRVQRASTPLLDFDAFLLIFEEGEEVERRDWRLAWDLVVVRLIDQLHERKWFAEHKDIVQEESEAAEARAQDQDDFERLPAGVP